MTINPFHDDETLLGPAAKAMVFISCGHILGDTATLICQSKEIMDDLTEQIKENSPAWIEFIQTHISAIRVKAFGSDVYEPKNGLEVRLFYRETLCYCLDMLNRNEAGIAYRRAERDKARLAMEEDKS